MDLLTAVNRILPKLGEHQVTGLSVKHPTLAIILPEIEAKRQEFLLKGWWFNTEHYTFYPSSEGFIDTPNALLGWNPDPWCSAVQRGERFYDPVNHTYTWPDKISGSCTFDVEFELMPEAAAQYVLYHALVLCYATDIGLEQVVQVWEREAGTALAACEREHLRYKKYTTRHSRRWRNLQSALRG